MNRITKTARFVPAAVVGLLLLLVLHTHGHVIEPVFFRYLIIWIPVLLLLERLQAWQAARGLAPAVSGRNWPVVGLLFFLILFFFSCTTDHPWFYFISWMPNTGSVAHLIASAMGQFVLFTALLTPFLIKPIRRLPVILLALLLATQVACVVLVLKRTGGAPLYGDDHASF